MFASYSQDVLDSPEAVSVGQGVDFHSDIAPAGPGSPTQSLMNALAKYANYHEPNPTEGQIFGWLAGSLVIEGLKVAGRNLTWGSFISNLRNVHEYTNTGLSGPVNFSKFGYTDPTTIGTCFYMATLKGNKFVSNSKPYCGKAIPGTDNAQNNGSS